MSTLYWLRIVAAVHTSESMLNELIRRVSWKMRIAANNMSSDSRAKSSKSNWLSRNSEAPGTIRRCYTHRTWSIIIIIIIIRNLYRAIMPLGVYRLMIVHNFCANWFFELVFVYYTLWAYCFDTAGHWFGLESRSKDPEFGSHPMRYRVRPSTSRSRICQTVTEQYNLVLAKLQRNVTKALLEVNGSLVPDKRRLRLTA